MTPIDEILIRTIQNISENRAARFARQFVRASPDEKEALLAALDFENWLAETCGVSLARHGTGAAPPSATRACRMVSPEKAS